MAKKYFSPYSPRRRQSRRVVLVWVSTFVFILWLTWFISTRRREQALPYVDEFMHPGQKVHRAVVEEDE
jgi:hypothetical protein